ncbi:slc38a7 [Symbiodinium sp. KB8]|nr:slc38a7 [Symbiodinium sp. KB8]
MSFSVVPPMEEAAAAMFPPDDGDSPNGGDKKGLTKVSSSVFLLSTMSLGVGVFSLPTVWNEIGWLWGMGLCCYFGLLSTLLMLNLLDIVKHHNTESWEELCRFAPLARTCSRVSLLISLLIGNAAHMQTIAGMLFDILTFFITDDYGQYHFSNTQRAVLILIFLGVASPFCFADNLAALQHVGHSVALVVMLLCAAVVVTSCVTIGRGLGAHGEFATPATVPDFKAFLTSAPNVCFAFTGMLSFWEVFAALKKGAGVDEAFPRMKKTAICSGILVLSLYLLVSGFCIWTFGTEAGKQRKGNGFGNVLYNFPITDYPITLLCAALVVVIVLEYPIINFPMVNMILNVRTLGLKNRRYARHFISLAGMLIVILLDLAVPDLPDVFGLCGSLGLSLFCYVVPGYICIVAGRGLLGKIVGAFAVVTGLTMLFGGTFFILKRVVTGTE